MKQQQSTPSTEFKFLSLSYNVDAGDAGTIGWLIHNAKSQVAAEKIANNWFVQNGYVSLSDATQHCVKFAIIAA